MKFSFRYNDTEIWAFNKEDAFKKFKCNFHTNCIKSIDQIKEVPNSGFSCM